jgi:branched-chain amino acid transport system permease protein
MELFLLQFIGGLSKAMFLFLIAAGLSLIWGVSRVFNLCHTSLFMLGAYIEYSVFSMAIHNQSQFFIALIVTPLAIGVIGLFIEIFLLRPLYRVPQGGDFIIFLTIGLIFIIGDIVRMIWGAQYINIPKPPILLGSFEILGYVFPKYYIPILTVSPLIALGIWALINYTRFGLLLRASTMDREMLSALGINVSRLNTYVYFLACCLTGLAGALAAPALALFPAMDGELIMEAIAVVVIGGLGSLPGSFVAALLIAEVESFGILAFPAMSLVIVFAIMAGVIIIRPWGLFGRPEL